MYCMTAGRGATEVYWMLRVRRLVVEHCKLAARGLLSFLSLLGAFLLNATKRNQRRGVSDAYELRPSMGCCGRAAAPGGCARVLR